MRTVIPLFLRSTLILVALLVPNIAAAQQSAAPVTPRKWTLEELFQRNVGSEEKRPRPFHLTGLPTTSSMSEPRAWPRFWSPRPRGTSSSTATYEANDPVIRARSRSWDSSSPISKSSSAATPTAITWKAMRSQRNSPAPRSWRWRRTFLASKMTPGNKPHPIDKILKDGEQVTLGGATLTAHLTPVTLRAARPGRKVKRMGDPITF